MKNSAQSQGSSVSGMRLTITATDKLTDIDGVPVRLWMGVSESGVPCYVFVHRIAVYEAEDLSLLKVKREALQFFRPI